MTAFRDKLYPAAIDREIADIQSVLLDLDKEKTSELYLASLPQAPARRPQERPDQGRVTARFAGIPSVRHGTSFAGIFNVRHYGKHANATLVAANLHQAVRVVLGFCAINSL